MSQPQKNTHQIGVIADTHHPDRLRQLPADAILNALAGSELILHAGDITHPRVLTLLEQVAPVLAVKGNRDIWHPALRHLPLDRRLQIGPATIGLTHGHGGLLPYIAEKIEYLLHGYPWEKYPPRIYRRFTPPPNVIIFGHTHRPTFRVIGHTLLFNPGAVSPTPLPGHHNPTVGRLTITPHTITAHIIPLDGSPGQHTHHTITPHTTEITPNN